MTVVTGGATPERDVALAGAGEVVRALRRCGHQVRVVDISTGCCSAEEEERLGDHVHATDGEIGQLRALWVDPGTHQVTHVHVQLREGHAWRHKDVAIPSGSVSGFTGGIHLSISKSDVEELAHGHVAPPR